MDELEAELLSGLAKFNDVHGCPEPLLGQPCNGSVVSEEDRLDGSADRRDSLEAVAGPCIIEAGEDVIADEQRGFRTLREVFQVSEAQCEKS